MSRNTEFVCCFCVSGIHDIFEFWDRFGVAVTKHCSGRSWIHLSVPACCTWYAPQPSVCSWRWGGWANQEQILPRFLPGLQPTAIVWRRLWHGDLYFSRHFCWDLNLFKKDTSRGRGFRLTFSSRWNPPDVWLPWHERCSAPEPMSLPSTVAEICFCAYTLPQSFALGPSLK